MKIRLFYIVPIVISVCYFLAYLFEGSSIAEDGTLIESFGLIPIGYLFLAIGIIAVVIVEVRMFYKKKKGGE